jgi:hypothetical protein
MTKVFNFTSVIVLFTPRAMTLGIVLDLVLVAISLLGVDSPLKMPGGSAYAIKAIVLLIGYGLVAIWTSTNASRPRQTALHWGGSVGVFVGFLQVLHMVLENFGHRVGEKPDVTLVFMFSAFLLWGAAGYSVTRRTGDIKAGLFASCWSAMISVMMAATFGLVLMSANIPSPDYIATWNEFKQSGWGDARAFGIANSLDAAFSHLVVGPIVGMIVGVFGAGVARLQSRHTTANSSSSNPDI